jgi:acetyltransferase
VLHSSGENVQIIEVEKLERYREQLVKLLCNCVDDGASIGFIAPLSISEADEYWKSVENDLSDSSKVMFLAQDKGQIIGTVQLSLCKKKNGLHRAEVEKLMVHTSARGKGAGKALMLELESKAQSIKKSLLVLDTRKGDVASSLYEAIGYQLAGEIPEFASNSDGGFDSTLYYYKQNGM